MSIMTSYSKYNCYHNENSRRDRTTPYELEAELERRHNAGYTPIQIWLCLVIPPAITMMISRWHVYCAPLLMTANSMSLSKTQLSKIL